MSQDIEVLIGVSDSELEALAEVMLASSLQARLDDLIARSKERELSSDESAELDRLFARVDQLTLLKTHVKYTIWHQRR